jgi:beta-glucuronidase
MKVKETFDRPVLITEYGADCYDQNKMVVNEEYQATYHRRAWRDIESNSAQGEKAGNAIGGVVFCWLDKWWLCGSADEHDTENGAWQGVSIDGWSNDEWMGMCGQGKGENSPFLRQPRKVYYVYRDELWNALPDGE